MYGIIEKIKSFISYWYLRYLVVTELYMVETWERVFIHVVFAIVFVALYYFNSSIVLGTIAEIRGGLPLLNKDISRDVTGMDVH